MSWGIEPTVVERFTAAGVPAGKISFAKDTFVFRFPGTPAEFVEIFRRYYGPTMNAFEAADKNGRAEELQQELVELFTHQNRSGRSDSTIIPATYLRVTVN
jgi:hypothetical protein